MARRFFLATIVQAAVCLALALGLGWIWGPPPQTDRIRLPTAFQYGTAFLAVGSYFLHVSRKHVRQERQPEFRRALMLALIFAIQ